MCKISMGKITKLIKIKEQLVERYSMFMDEKTQYYQDISSSQFDLYI